MKQKKLSPGDNHLQGIRKALYAILCIVIVIITIEYTYQSLPENGSLGFDDPQTVFKNTHVTSFQTLNWDSARALNDTVQGNHVPLTQYTHALDYKKYGNDASGHHTTSLRIYEATAVLVFIVCYLLGGNMFVAFIVALIFGTNPMHVEAIAWISARKDQMMGLMVFTTILIYLGYLESLKLSRGWKKIVAIVVFQIILTISFYLAIISKGMSVTLPIGLLAIDYLKKRPWRESIFEKIILFGLMIYFGIDAYAAQQESGFINRLNLAPLEHVTLGSYGLVVQTIKFFIPYHGWLCAHIDNEYNQLLGIPSTIIVCLWMWSLWKFRHVREYVFGTVFYFSCFIIVQYFPVANIIMAERYIHVGSVGLSYAILVPLIQYLRKSRPWIMIISGLLGACYFVFLIHNSMERIPVWKNDGSLWSDVLKKQPRNISAMLQLAEVANDQTSGHCDYSYAIRLSTAIMASGQFQKECLNIRMHAYLQTNNLELARQDCYAYLHYDPNDSIAGIVLTNTANQFAAEDKTDSAIVWYTRLAQFPGNSKKLPLIYRNLAVLYQEKHLFSEALQENARSLAVSTTTADSTISYQLRDQIIQVQSQFK